MLHSAISLPSQEIRGTPSLQNTVVFSNSAGCQILNLLAVGNKNTKKKIILVCPINPT